MAASRNSSPGFLLFPYSVLFFGLFGMTFFGGVLGMGYSLLSGSLTLALMVLPLIVRNTQRALREVPEGYRYGALGLGAGNYGIGVSRSPHTSLISRFRNNASIISTQPIPKAVSYSPQGRPST